MAMGSAPPLIRMAGIRKSFGAVHALRGVGLEVRPGETFALLGDNAAGKSTLMKILTGVYQPDAGSIEIDGAPVTFSGPADSRGRGIEMVYQDFALADHLDVRANIFLGREVRRPLLGRLLRVLDNKHMERESERVLAMLDLPINPRLKVRRLSGGQRQGVAIGRALAFDARLIVMDEPTASLSVAKVEKLLDITRRLKTLGIAVIMITHRLDEALAVSDRVVVMRQGEVVGRFEAGAVTEAEISHLIAYGRPSDAEDQAESRGGSAPSPRATTSMSTTTSEGSSL